VGSVKIEGLGELEAALKLKVAELREGAVAAVAEEVELTANDAESGAPVDTGHLRGSIQRRAGDLEGEVRATARYAAFVEHGTYKDPAQPFMKPAADKARRRFPATAAAIIRKALGA